MIVKQRHDSEKTVVVYGGALCKRFGVNKLVDAFMHVNSENAELRFYGSGESEQYIREMHIQDPRVKYCGIVAYDEMLSIQRRADLLVNPRPSDEDFTKYSFPSKTLSYMLSKTPILSTRLASIPNDYEKFIYWFDDETEEGMSRRIQEILDIPLDERIKKSELAYEYVVNHKNARSQATKILDFLQNLAGAESTVREEQC